MSLTEALKRRYTAKSYDPTSLLPEELVASLLESLRLSPSSVNVQPWHFFVAADETGKAPIIEAMHGSYAYNAAKVRDASHVVVLCARTELGDDYLEQLLDQEQADGRLADAAARQGLKGLRSGYVSQHRQAGSLAQWTRNQTYLALGSLLLAAGLLGVDATPMEGFDAASLERALGLSAQGLSAVVVVALGHHGPDDFNAALPKSRLPATAVFTRL